MKFAYYPGCALHSYAKDYDISFRLVCSRLGIELTEVPNWVCCGAMHFPSDLFTYAVQIENLFRAEQIGINQMLIPCAVCYYSIKNALHEYKGNSKNDIIRVLENEKEPEIGVSHPLEILNEKYLSSIGEKVTNPLKGLKLVSYYGCLLTRPPQVLGVKEYEYPTAMDNLLKICGANCLDWSYKVDCCGAGFSMNKKDVVIDLSYRIIKDAKEVGVEAIVVACPMCHLNLDGRQAEMEKKFHEKLQIPILYFTQVLGLAFGFTPKQLGLNRHLVSPLLTLQKLIV